MIHIVVNEKSKTGKGQNVWREVKKTLEYQKVPYKEYKTEYVGHATGIAKHLCDVVKDGDKVVILGGDGTINEFINGITDFDKIRLGIIPSGSGNDFARGLGIKGTPQFLINRILDIKECQTIDIGSITIVDKGIERKFAISSGVGLDAIVCKKANGSKLKKQLNKLGLGQITYIVLTIINLFTMETMDAQIEYDGGKRSVKKMIFSAAMNFSAEGGGVPMAPKADAKDGLLSVCCVHGIPKWKTFFLLPLLVMAKHENIKGFNIINSRYFHLKATQPMTLHTDGEYIADVKEVLYECLPDRLKLII